MTVFIRTDRMLFDKRKRSDQRLNIVPLQADCGAFGGVARSFGADRIAKPLFFPNKPS